MKKKGPSNVFAVPNWMKNLRVAEPEGTYTPDQITRLLEINMQFNDNDPKSLRRCIKGLIGKVPLSRQKLLKAFIAQDDGPMLESVRAFIAKVAESLAQLTQEAPHVEPREEELPAGGLDPATDGESPLPCSSSDWGDDWDRPRESNSSRGKRAVRQAKRGQAEDGSRGR